MIVVRIRLLLVFPGDYKTVARIYGCKGGGKSCMISNHKLLQTAEFGGEMVVWQIE